jgi:hypothetical protein
MKPGKLERGKLYKFTRRLGKKNITEHYGIYAKTGKNGPFFILVTNTLKDKKFIPFMIGGNGTEVTDKHDTYNKLVAEQLEVIGPVPEHYELALKNRELRKILSLTVLKKFVQNYKLYITHRRTGLSIPHNDLKSGKKKSLKF